MDPGSVPRTLMTVYSHCKLPEDINNIFKKKKKKLPVPMSVVCHLLCQVARGNLLAGYTSKGTYDTIVLHVLSGAAI